MSNKSKKESNRPVKEYRQATLTITDIPASKLKALLDDKIDDDGGEPILSEKEMSVEELNDEVVNNQDKDKKEVLTRSKDDEDSSDEDSSENISDDTSELTDDKIDDDDTEPVKEKREEDKSKDDITVIEKEQDTDRTTLSNDMTIEGTAVVFNKRTLLYSIDDVDYYEVIDEHAFDGVDLSDCCLRYNHNDGFQILARTRNKSLELFIDEEGLKFKARIVDTQQGRDVYKLIQEGLVTSCSFGFTVKEDEFDVLTNTRRIKKFDKVFEISLVDFPAYEDTNVQVSERDYFSAQHEIYLQRKLEERKRRLILLTY